MIRVEDVTDTKPKKRGLRDNAEEVASLYLYDPRKLHVQEGWNSRTVTFSPEDEDDIALARSIAEVGVTQPLTAFLRDGLAYITDGHRRLAATLYAMDVLGADIKTVKVQAETKASSEADRVLSQLVRNQGKPLAPIEKANVYAKLIGFGWSETEIGKKVGVSRNYVSDLLKLRASDSAVVDMVKAGEVSAGLAMETIKAAGGDGAAAAETLTKAVSTAKAEGKTRATAKHVERKAPDLARHPAWKAGMRRAVQILRESDAMFDGSSDAVAAISLMARVIEAEVG